MHHEKHLCNACGYAWGHHHATQKLCPVGPFPKWPGETEDQKGFEAAQREFGDRIDRYWAKSKTTFIPR